MTEDEAKALASELESHKDWRVTRVYEEWPFHWTITFARRDDPAKTGLLRGNPGAKTLAEILSGAFQHFYPTKQQS